MLLGSDAVEVVGVTTTFGNGPEESVHIQTRDLLAAAGRPDIPIIRGAGCAGDSETAAASFIAQVASEYRGELAILAIGSLTNLAGALRMDPLLGRNVARAYIMGGYLRRLRFLRREVTELNLSCDPGAASAVFQSDIAVTLMSAQLCLQARYGLRHLVSDLIRKPRLARLILVWFAVFSYHCGTVGFYLWDLVPAWAILDHDRFIHRRVRISSTARDLASGTLRTSKAPHGMDSEAGVIDLPSRIRSRFGFATGCARLWRRVPLHGYVQSRVRASRVRASRVGAPRGGREVPRVQTKEQNNDCRRETHSDRRG